MRFSLSTCLLILTLLSVALGWWVDRTRFNRELALGLETQKLVDDIAFRTRQAKQPKRFERPNLETPNRLLVVAVVQLFEHSDDVTRLNSMKGHGDSACVITNDVLSKLAIDSTDDYFKALSSFHIPRGKFADYANPESDRHNSLRMFVDKCCPKPDPAIAALEKMGIDPKTISPDTFSMNPR